MHIARLDSRWPRYAIRVGEGWAVVEDCFADPPILTGVTVSDADARQLAPCEPRVLVGIAHNKTNNDHPLPIQPGTSRCSALSARRGHPGQT